MTALPGTRLSAGAYFAKYEQWLDQIARNHHARNPREPQRQAFRPLRRPLAEARVALVSTAGVHLDDQQPFHVETVAGDPTFRLIPDDIDVTRLRFRHTHYDTTSAERDPNVVFPLDRLHEAVASGRVGSSSPIHIGLMGFNPDPVPIVEETAPAVADVLEDAQADVVALVPG